MSIQFMVRGCDQPGASAALGRSSQDLTGPRNSCNVRHLKSWESQLRNTLEIPQGMTLKIGSTLFHMTGTPRNVEPTGDVCFAWWNRSAVLGHILLDSWSASVGPRDPTWCMDALLHTWNCWNIGLKRVSSATFGLDKQLIFNDLTLSPSLNIILSLHFKKAGEGREGHKVCLFLLTAVLMDSEDFFFFTPVHPFLFYLYFLA